MDANCTYRAAFFIVTATSASAPATTASSATSAITTASPATTWRAFSSTASLLGIRRRSVTYAVLSAATSTGASSPPASITATIASGPKPTRPPVGCETKSRRAGEKGLVSKHGQMHAVISGLVFYHFACIDHTQKHQHSQTWRAPTTDRDKSEPLYSRAYSLPFTGVLPGPVTFAASKPCVNSEISSHKSKDRQTHHS